MLTFAVGRPRTRIAPTSPDAGKGEGERGWGQKHADDTSASGHSGTVPVRKEWKAGERGGGVVAVVLKAASETTQTWKGQTRLRRDK